MAIKTVQIEESEQCQSTLSMAPPPLENSLDTLPSFALSFPSSVQNSTLSPGNPSATFSSASKTKSHHPTPGSTPTSASITTALSTLNMSDSPSPIPWSPWLGLPVSPPLSPGLRLPSPTYMLRTPTPRPPVPSAALSPLFPGSPVELQYPSIASTPPMSPVVREESLSPILPDMASPTPQDLFAPPWQLWTTHLGYPPYEVDLGEGPITLPYVCFGTHLGVPWQLGKLAPDGEVYARQVTSAPCHRPYLPSYPGVNDNELGIFLKDATFNFALNQSIEFTDDPGLVADIGLYRHLATEAAGWKRRTDQMNHFAAVYHAMQHTFQEEYEAYRQELVHVKQRLVAARARTRVHAAMVQLISQNQLGGRHYWMGLPGLDSHPCPQVLPEPPRFVMAKDQKSQVYVPVPAPLPSHLPDVINVPPSPSISPSSFVPKVPTPEDHRMAGKRPRNKCPHCGKGGHFGRECKTPHLYCAARGYCKVRAKSDCKYPRAHGRQARMVVQRKRARAGSSGYTAKVSELELAIQAGADLFDMDWSN